MAVGMTFVIITGGIDLSVGATYALASVCGALVLTQYRAFRRNGRCDCLESLLRSESAYWADC